MSRDVTFFEKYFSFHYQPSSTSLPQFFLPISTPAPSTYDYLHPLLPFSDGFAPIPTLPTVPVSHNPPVPNATPLSTNPAPIISPPPTPDSTLHPPLNPPLRRSQRHLQPPPHLQEYHCNSVISNHWCNLVSFQALTSTHKHISQSQQQHIEPKSYIEASCNPHWVAAMQHELNALETNHTWSLVDLPKGKKAIGCKWVFKTKLKANGNLERYKACLVVKGFNQRYGVDFEETFSPVVKMTTIRCLLAVAAHHNWPINQLDVNNAFLHGDLHEEVFMKVPEGLPNPGQQVCRLHKSFYGLKQASRQWFAKLVHALHQQDFQQSKHDYSLFIKRVDTDITIMVVYVDDILITGNNPSTITSLKEHLNTVFSIKDLGSLHYFLGMEASYST